MKHEQSGTGGEQANLDSRSGGAWVFPALLAVVLIVAVGVAKYGSKGAHSTGADQTPTEWSPTPQPQGKTVGLTIDFGNGAKKQFDALSWRVEMTAEGLMREAVRYRPGIRFTQQGEEETGFLQSIDGLKNQGVDGRNWSYEVNGRHAEISFCLQMLEPGDRVLWKFASRE